METWMTVLWAILGPYLVVTLIGSIAYIIDDDILEDISPIGLKESHPNLNWFGLLLLLIGNFILFPWVYLYLLLIFLTHKKGDS